MRALKYSVTFCLLIASSVVNAADWNMVTVGANGSIYFIDRDSVRDQTDYPRHIRSAWFKTNDANNSKVNYRESKLFYKFDCSESEMKISQWINYDKNGLVMDSSGTIYSSTYQAVAPDTIGYALMEAACFPKPSAQ